MCCVVLLPESDVRWVGGVVVWSASCLTRNRHPWRWLAGLTSDRHPQGWVAGQLLQGVAVVLLVHSAILLR
eukprot:7911885-Prorocentrum_lima.AAC.1